MEATQQQVDEQTEAMIDKTTELEARIGRQAIMIENLQAAIGECNSQYQNLIGNVAKLVSGEVALDRFKILPDGLSWQVLALPVTATEPESLEQNAPEIKLHETEPAAV